MDLAHRRLSSNHLETYEEKEVKGIQMDEGTFDHNIKDKQIEIFLETIDDHSSGKDSSHENDSERQMNVINKGESGKNNYFDTHINGTKSISSSSPESPLDYLFRKDEEFKYTNFDESIHASKSGKSYVSNNESFDKSKVDTNLLVATSNNQVYNLSHSQKSMPLIASPPSQVMDRFGRYDASRVPSSIFEPNTNPLEWSIGSNDSLFSIQLGQPSFSREKALMCGELGLSGDFTKLSESNNKVPSVMEEELETAIKNVVENLQTTKMQGSFKLEREGIDEANNEIKTSHQTKSFKSSKSIVSCLSNNSGSDMSTSDFPIKKCSRSCGIVIIVAAIVVGHFLLVGTITIQNIVITPL